LPEPGVEAVTISVYPNPAKEYIYLSEELISALPDPEYRLFGLAGNEIATGRIPGGRIDVSGLTPGIYFLEVISGKDRYVARFAVSE
jgi:hypothetical protein